MSTERLDQIRTRLANANGRGLDEAVARHYRKDVPWMLTEIEESRKANAALLRERNTWARQLADLRDERDTARDEAKAAGVARAGAEHERDLMSVRAEAAEEALTRVSALANDRACARPDVCAADGDCGEIRPSEVLAAVKGGA